MKIAARSHRFLIVGGVLALAACAATPQPPTDALQAADIALANADNDHAADFAPVEMRAAREKLAAAHASPPQPDEQSVQKARRLADEATVDAQLASAKARLARADTVNQELQKSSDTLRQEVQRNSGV